MPVDRCPICGGLIQQHLQGFQYVYRGVPIKIADIPHLVCSKCGEALFDYQYGRIVEESIDQYQQFKCHDDNDLLTCEEVAALLAVSYQVIIAMLSEGKLPGTKIGREWRVPYGLLMEYIQSMSAHNLSEPEKDIYQSFTKRAKPQIRS